LGTGTSQGVPVIACQCEVCKSTDIRDKRLRTSLAFMFDEGNVVIDAGPDFRQQMLQGEFQSLEAILFTHEHKDHIAGLDDVRAFNFQSNKEMEIYCTFQVFECLSREFQYVFDPEFRYPGIPRVHTNFIDKNSAIDVLGHSFTPIEVLHYKLPVLGFRVGNSTYITDANYISPDEFKKIEGTEYLVINALRKEQHISHFNLTEALDIIQKVNPKKAFLTHISHLMGKHAEVLAELPNNVTLAYDGLEVVCE
jgi:phosphoribosyl 1,2-cyclic phosphate phosphodiesterase